MKLENKSPRRRARSASEWRAEVEAWKATGLPAAAYASQQGLHPHTLEAWASKLKVEPTRKGSPGATDGGSGKSFLPVKMGLSPTTGMKTATGAASAFAPRLQVEVELSGGRRLRLLGNLEVEQLVRLLVGLEGGVAC